MLWEGLFGAVEIMRPFFMDGPSKDVFPVKSSKVF